VRTVYDVVLSGFPKVQAGLLRVVQLSLAVTALAAIGADPALAQRAERELLNSERIAEEFGSYGVEVLEQSDGLRISNLYSAEADLRTCRTFAIVRYPSNVDPVVANEHAAILAGGSIGATFAEHGWEVRKTHLFFGEQEASARLAELMRIARGTRLARHIYVLDVAKGDQVIEYAALIEIHHPDYLTLADLVRIYGPATTGREILLALLLIAALEDTR